jgi:hypothetical protein
MLIFEKSSGTNCSAGESNLDKKLPRPLLNSVEKRPEFYVAKRVKHA